MHLWQAFLSCLPLSVLSYFLSHRSKPWVCFSQSALHWHVFRTCFWFNGIGRVTWIQSFDWWFTSIHCAFCYFVFVPIVTIISPTKYLLRKKKLQMEIHVVKPVTVYSIWLKMLKGQMLPSNSLTVIVSNWLIVSKS